MRKFQLVFLLATIAFASCNNESSQPATENKDTSTAASATATTNLKEENINYLSSDKNYNAYVVYNDNAGTPKPAIIVVPEWWGLNEYAKSRAKQLADLGYVAMAIDMYGEGKQADNPDSAGKLAGAFYGDPQMGKSRIDAAITKLKTYSQVDTGKIAAIGYCFGGSMVLNAARLGSDLDGVVSFHGVLGPLPSLDKNKLKSEILVCNGGADKFTSSKDSAAFRKQLDDARATYDFKTYPNALHAFTNPKADEYAAKFKGLAVGYNAEADKQSWEDMKNFLNKVLK